MINKYYANKEKGIISIMDIGMQAYYEYLLKNRKYIPHKIYKMITSKWDYSIENHKCPHDAWVENIMISEILDSGMTIKLELLGAYHDLRIIYSYSKIESYSLNYKHHIFQSSHGDWARDRFIVSSGKKIIHYIQFVEKSDIKIECGKLDIEFIDLKK